MGDSDRKLLPHANAITTGCDFDGFYEAVRNIV